MAVDQRKKRPNAASVVGCSSREQHKSKKKNLRSPQYDLKMRSHVSLEWDDDQKRVVPKKEQIGIARRDLTPFIDYAPHCHNALADVFAVPQEILELGNLTEVLSYEAWETSLTEKERNFLMHFLPRGLEAQQVVQALLGGDNFHFGNPFLKWGVSLCSGDLHPDVVLHNEQCFKANKKGYYSELQKYHNDIIRNLQKWKERWTSCKDPEKEIVQNLWRSKTQMDKNVSSHANEFRCHDPEENLTATSESCSWGTDEKGCSGDNLNSSIMKGGELTERKGFMKEKSGSSLVASDGLQLVARPRKGEKLHKRNIGCNDGAKYMSYIKISKKQHQLVKNMKQSGNNIQPRSLNRVLGNLDHFHVQPYEFFVEEERKKLREHWLQLANIDLPEAFANWRKGRLQRQQTIKSLEQEMKEKFRSLTEPGCQADDENSGGMLLERKDFRANDDELSNELNGDDEESSLASTPSQHLPEISPLNGSHHFSPMDMDLEDDHLVSKLDDAPPDVSEYSENLNSTDVALTQGVPLSSSEDVWPAASASLPYYSSTSRHEYAPTSELPLGHSQVIEGQQAHINLESDMKEAEMRKNLLHRQFKDGSLNSCPNQDRDELLQSFFKGRDMSSYHREPRQAGSNFQATANMFMESDHFPRHFQEQLQPPLSLEHMHNRLNEIYTRRNTQDNMFSDGGRYFIPRQEHIPPVSVRDWVVNPTRVLTPPQLQTIGGELLSQNLFPGERTLRGDLSGPDGTCISNHGIGNGDGSLFSVLSQCNEMRSGTYNSLRPTEQLISAGNHGVMGGSALRNSNVFPQAVNPLDYLGSREAASALMSSNLGWMSLPHQNSALHDSMGKSFLRSWNQ
ncbi:uncharacterized protein LOC131167714 isoform X3 [Malania oleifera]|uniref:uncharacterized protein LOC131167714 isoform X3 n=1 Tax=Malania oleifera TaxID=397392 RepID=UPI0025ADC476|nr:uncharacterized protein LOC131167714 isoform X3 [Malania oleifera]